MHLCNSNTGSSLACSCSLSQAWVAFCGQKDLNSMSLLLVNTVCFWWWQSQPHSRHLADDYDATVPRPHGWGTGGEKAGMVTSVTQLPDGPFIGLGYVRCRANGVQIPVEGLQLTAAGVKARVVSRPFASWHFPEGQGVQEPPPRSAGDLKDRALAAK